MSDWRERCSEQKFGLNERLGRDDARSEAESDATRQEGVVLRGHPSVLTRRT